MAKKSLTKYWAGVVDTAMAARRQITALRLWMASLVVVMLIGLVAGLIVLARGLVVTGLNDRVPWGLWITADLSSIAMSAGAFSLSAAVYLLGLKQLRPVARVAVFIGLIGYTMALLFLILDIGRPDRFWHALVFWNPHSVLWEVTMCVILYLSVLVVEFAPIVGEMEWMRRKLPRLAKAVANLHHAAPVLAVAGLFLSLLHQSSLGATYGILKARPLWYKPDMSILFIVSALAGGQSLTLLACMAVGKLRRRVCVDRSLLDGVARFIGFTLLAYLYLKFWDSLSMSYTYAPGRTEGLQLLTAGPLQWNFWLGEVLIGGIIPAVILLSARLRAHDRALMMAAGFIVVGVMLSRWDVNLAGLLMLVSYIPDVVPGAVLASYHPTWIEWAATAGIVAYGLMAFTFGARYLPVFTASHEAGRVEAPIPPLPVAPQATSA